MKTIKTTNDEQEWAIIDKITESHKYLCSLYKDLENLKIQFEEEIERTKMSIDNQEAKVMKLASGRIKTFYDKKTKQLILDLTDDTNNTSKENK